MNTYKICVYAICKNEERFVDRWMDAVSEADMVVVADTGSTDGTVDKLRARGAHVYNESVVPWRFDEARNRALSHIPEDVDICVSNDLDEVFEAGWRQKLEAVWRPEYTRARYMFAWSHDQNGNITKQYPMEKIHRRQGYKWVHPVHEVLAFDGTENTVWIPDFVLHHYPDNNKPRSQYLPLLELSAKENPQDDRVRFWLGRELMYYKSYDACIQTLTQYLKLPTAVWPEERSAAMRFIASCYEQKQDLVNARKWLWQSIAQCPHVREPYLAMVQMGYRSGDWPLVAMMVSEALKITHPSGSYLTEPAAWGYAFYDYGAIACYRLEQYETALQHAHEACRLNPQDGRLKRNLELIEQKISETALSKA